MSTKGNLKMHLGVPRTNTSIETRHSCPICQKRFSDVALRQQHVQMHMGSQIPHTPLPQIPCDFPGPEAPTVSHTAARVPPVTMMSSEHRLG